MKTKSTDCYYVHGYSEREHERLEDQASTLTELLHHDTVYPDGCRVLEAGCGVGAQTVTLVKNSPRTRFTSIDLSMPSIEAARSKTGLAGRENLAFARADIFNLPFTDGCFDHIFVCFVLEHLPNPDGALFHLRSKLKEGGTITVIEGDHGSAYYSPQSHKAWQTIQCLIDLQAAGGGDSLIGRRLYPVLTRAGFKDVRISPRMVYVDSSRPRLVEGFTRNTFIAMVEGVREAALGEGMISETDWEAGIKDLYRTAEADGTFCYTFFKGIGRK